MTGSDVRPADPPSRSPSLGNESGTDHYRHEQSDGDDDDDHDHDHDHDHYLRQQHYDSAGGGVLSFGILADIQYAPIPDGFSYGGTPRYYRHALEAAGIAAAHFEREGVDLVVNLGDAIDGKCQDVEWPRVEGGDGEQEQRGRSTDGNDDDNDGAAVVPANPGRDALKDVLSALGKYSSGPILHTYGNHELYNLDRDELSTLLGIPFVREPCGDLVGYRSYRHSIVAGMRAGFGVNSGATDGVDVDVDVDKHEYEHEYEQEEKKDDCAVVVTTTPTTMATTASETTTVTTTTNAYSAIRFVVLDSYDVAVVGRCPATSTKRKEAERLLSIHNPNFPSDSNSPAGINGLDRRYVAFNGGVGQDQLRWLDEILTEARNRNERVVILSHQPILPESSSPYCLVWNYKDVLDVLRRHSQVVMASFAGHAHRGGYGRDVVSGIHFRVLEAVLESPRPVRTYGIVDIYDDKIVVKGMGDLKSAVYDLDHLDAEREKASTTKSSWCSSFSMSSSSSLS